MEEDRARAELIEKYEAEGRRLDDLTAVLVAERKGLRWFLLGLPVAPLAALYHWLLALGIVGTAVFRECRTVRRRNAPNDERLREQPHQGGADAAHEARHMQRATLTGGPREIPSAETRLSARLARKP